MSVSDIESNFASRLDKFAELGVKMKFDFGDDQLFVDGTQNPAVMSHDDDEADCTVVAGADVIEKILHKQLDPQMAFMTGKLKVKGNTALARKLGFVLQ